MRQRLPYPCLAVLAALLCGAAGAVAATTRVDTHYGDRGAGTSSVSYFAGSGEANRLSVGLERGRFAFEDAGARIEPGPPCTGGGHRVTCGPGRGARLLSLYVHLLDGENKLTVLPSIAGLTASGGDGRDVMRITGSGRTFTGHLAGYGGDDVLSTTRGGTLEGGPGADRLHGGARRARLLGGTGPDVFAGGGGDDVLTPGIDDDPDLLDGGPGRDTVDYSEFRLPPREVVVDLSVPSAAPGDELRSIEGAIGSHGADVLRGSEARDRLVGASGDDTVRGGAGDDLVDGDPGADDVAGGSGDDTVIGGPGRDTISGGPGDDFVDPWAWDPQDHLESVSCGSGRDVVLLPDLRRDVPASFRALPSDCELLDVASSSLARFRARPAVAGGVARWSLLCRRATWKGRCPTTFELRAGDAALGRGGASPRRGERGALSVHLNAAGRRLARGGGTIEVTMRMKSDFGGFASGQPRRFAVSLPGR